MPERFREKGGGENTIGAHLIHERDNQIHEKGGYVKKRTSGSS